MFKAVFKNINEFSALKSNEVVESFHVAVMAIDTLQESLDNVVIITMC